jgi:hypothetical protein
MGNHMFDNTRLREAPTHAGTNVLLAGGYGRVATTVQIKAVLLCNRYVEISAHLTGPIDALRVDNSARFVFSPRPATRKGLLALVTDQ